MSLRVARMMAAIGALFCVLGTLLWWGPDHSGYQIAFLGVRTVWQASAGVEWIAIGALLAAFGALPPLAGIGLVRALAGEKWPRVGIMAGLLIAWLGLFVLFEPRDELGYGIGLLLTLAGTTVGGAAGLFAMALGRRARAAKIAAAPTRAAIASVQDGGPILIVQDLDVHYGAVHALKGISLEVAKGEIVALLGSNGAGKTTTLRALSGLVTPSGGRVEFNGRNVAGCSPDEIVRLGVAHAPEGRGVFANLSVRENLDLGAYSRKDRPEIAKDLDKVFHFFPRLKERINQRAGTLSGGEQQMLAIGRAMMARPKLLLLDEPSLGLAPTITQTIFRIIQDINKQGTTILLVEQNAHQALKVAHKGYVLETGEIVMRDTAAALAASDEVRKAYLGVA